MIDDNVKMLTATVKKLYHRDAKHNIQRIFVKTHEADISSIIGAFEPGEMFDLFQMVSSIEKQSEVLSHLEPDQQQEIISCLSHQEALKLVSAMDSDDAADLLGHLPEEEAQLILSSMGKEDSDEVSDLMGYPEDSAGGLMSSDYLALNQELSVADAIKEIQNNEELGATFYIYVINDDAKLVGVLSLKQLLLSRKSEQLKSLMVNDVISVTIDMDQEQVAKSVEHYDFLSIPVVNNTNQLMGVITVDDVIDVIREEAEEDFLAMGQAGIGVNSSTFERVKARLPWLIFAFIGGIMCFAIVHAFDVFTDPEHTSLWVIAAFIPLLLSVGGTTGSQAATVAVGAIRSNRYESHDFIPNLISEFKLAAAFAMLFAIIVYLLAHFLLGLTELALLLSLAIGLQIVFAMIFGNITPVLLKKINIDPTVASVPIFAAVVDVGALIILFMLFKSFYAA